MQHLLNVAVDYRNGIFAGTNDVVRDVTGVEPLTVEAFVERNRDSFAGASGVDIGVVLPGLLTEPD